jgi:hypothetical protein
VKSPWLSSFGSVFSMAALTVVLAGCGGSSTVVLPPPPPLAITTSALPPGIQGQAYTFTLQAAGGTAPYQWSVVSPNGVPPGMQFSNAGVLSGSTSSYGLYDSTYQVQDSSSPPRTAYLTLRLQIVAFLTIQTTTLTNGGPPPNVGVNYSSVISVTGGFGTFSWGLLAGSGPLPAGVTLNSSNGLLSGRPTASGTYSFTVQVTSAGPPQQSATQSYSLTITNDLVILDPTEYRQAVVTKPFQLSLQALGGQPPYTWSLVGKSQFAPGLSFDPSTGFVAGSPTAVGDYGTVVQVTDSSSQPQTVQATFTIVVNQELHFYQTTLQDAIAGENYGANFATLGGIGPYTASLVAGSLPPGITLQSSNNEIFGNANAVGSSTFTIAVTDAEIPPVSVQQEFTLRVNPRLQFPFVSLPNGLVDTPYIYTFQASGGLLPLHWTISPYIPLPGWLAIDPATGTAGGTPPQALQTQFTVFVTDSSNPPQQDNINGFVQVLGKLSVTSSALPNIVPNTPVKMQIGAAGGIGQYTWTMTSGTLPTGLSLDPSTGTISGPASQVGTPTFAVEVSDAGPPAQTSAPQTLQLTVAANPGRNDSIATATPLSNGTYQASISPFSDPPNGVGNPDTDYFKLTANPGAIVALEIQAQRLVPPSPLDSVMEIVDSNGTRLTTCSPNSSTVGPFNQPCMNDDIETGVVTDSKLTLQVPINSPSAQTFFARVLDFRGSARPDFLYTLTVSGAN